MRRIVKKVSRSRIAPNSEINVPVVHILLNREVGRIRKIIWTLLLIASIAVCSFQSIDRLLLYISSPVEMITRIVRLDKIKFPSLTICPFDINSTPEIKREQMKYDEQSKGKTIESVFSLLDFGLNNERLWQLNSINERNTEVKYQMKKILPISISSLNLTKVSDLAYLGTCMTVISDSAMDFVGSAVVLRIKQLIEDDDPTEVDSAAFTIYAHADGLPAKHHAFFKGNIILRNHKTSIALTKSKFIYLNKSNDVCINIIDAAQCWTNCIESKLIKDAKCRLPYMSGKASKCTSSVDSFTAYNMTLKIYLETRPKHCLCPNSCVDDIYGLNVDVQGKLNNSTVLEIFFESDTMEIIEEKYSYDFVGFVCDLGGNLGFYLGISLLTIVEITECMIQWCRKLNVFKSWQ